MCMDQAQKAMILRIIMVAAEEAPFGDIISGSGPKADSPSQLKHRGGDARVQRRDADNESVSVLRALPTTSSGC